MEYSVCTWRCTNESEDPAVIEGFRPFFEPSFKRANSSR
jgi:hypothetical protein